MLAQATTLQDLTPQEAGLLGGFLGTFVIVAVIFLVISFIAAWKVFEKAGEKGWKALIPIWNTLVLLRIVGRPMWWIILFFIPVVGYIMWIIVAYDLSKSFGHGVGFTVGLVVLAFIFLLILGFGEDAYRGPGATLSEGGGQASPPPPPLPPAPA